jgi:UDP-N-acetylglucosamine 2-epimerase (non-hydrolysing)
LIRDLHTNDSPLICFVVGTTAEVVKIAPVVRLLNLRGVEFRILLTGQQGSDTWEAISQFGLNSNTIKILHTQDGISSITSAVRWFLRGLFKSLFRRREYTGLVSRNSDSVIVVHGDTLSTLLGSLVAKKWGVPIAHIEAGLRSKDIFNPFPEEIIRVFVSKMSSVNYAPSELAVDNLRGAPGEIVFTHGNTCIDTLSSLETGTTESSLVSDYALVLLHRTEFLRNKDVFKETVIELKKISEHNKLMLVADPIAMRQMSEVFHSEDQVVLLEKMDYFNFQKLVTGAKFVITDSGGLQEECASLGKPCLVHRRATERGDGLNENVKLSNWESGEILLFADTFSMYARPAAGKLTSPSEIIVDDLQRKGWT